MALPGEETTAILVRRIARKFLDLDTRLALGEHDLTRVAWRQALALLDDLHHPDADIFRAELRDLDGDQTVRSDRRCQSIRSCADR